MPAAKSKSKSGSAKRKSPAAKAKRVPQAGPRDQLYVTKRGDGITSYFWHSPGKRSRFVSAAKLTAAQKKNAISRRPHSVAARSAAKKLWEGDRKKYAKISDAMKDAGYKPRASLASKPDTLRVKTSRKRCPTGYVRAGATSCVKASKVSTVAKGKGVASLPSGRKRCPAGSRRVGTRCVKRRTAAASPAKKTAGRTTAKKTAAKKPSGAKLARCPNGTRRQGSRCVKVSAAKKTASRSQAKKRSPAKKSPAKKAASRSPAKAAAPKRKRCPNGKVRKGSRCVAKK